MTMGPVLYVGDPHGQLGHIVACAQSQNASAVVLLGDIQSPQALHLALEPIQDRVWFIHGNHDTDTPADFEHLWDSRLAHRNVHGRVVVLPDGTRLAGWAGCFAILFLTRASVRGQRVTAMRPSMVGIRPGKAVGATGRRCGIGPPSTPTTWPLWLGSGPMC